MSVSLNLLPPERKKLLAKRRITARANASLLMLFVGLLLITCMGAGSIVVLRYLYNREQVAVEDDLLRATAAYGELRKEVGQKNALLNTVRGLSGMGIAWSEKITDLFGAIPPGVRVVSIQGNAEKEPFILFSGQSPTRNSLILLEKRLRELPWLASLDAPNSNLIDRVNAPYEFRLLLKDL